MGVLAVALIKKRIENPDWPIMRIAIDGQLKCRNSVSAFENSKKNWRNVYNTYLNLNQFYLARLFRFVI
jgi:hypothetical protein